MTHKPEHVTQSTPALKILVVGASGGSGKAAVQQLIAAGHTVTAFSRRATSHFKPTGQLQPMNGDVMQFDDIAAAVADQDVVIVALGISENPLRVRLLGSAGTPVNVRSAGTQNVVRAMREHNVERLVVQSSYGVGETRKFLRFIDRLFFNLLLKPQISDTEIQEQVVRESGMHWVLVQPVHLTNVKQSTDPYVSTRGETREMKVSRSSVARFLALLASRQDYAGKTVSVSG